MIKVRLRSQATQNLPRAKHSRFAVFDIELGEDSFDVFVDGSRAQAENGRNLGIAFCLGDPAEDFGFSWSQTEGEKRLSIESLARLDQNQEEAGALFEQSDAQRFVTPAD